MSVYIYIYIYIYLYIVHVCAFDVNRNYLLHDTDKLKMRKDKWKQASKEANALYSGISREAIVVLTNS
jgi:hypothetical protein